MSDPTLDGGCTCGAVRYRLASGPMFVNCCHCTWCQRETGSAFVVNALIESDRLTVAQGEPILVKTPSESGQGQTIARCPTCHVALWSHYPGAGDKVSFEEIVQLAFPGFHAPDVAFSMTFRHAASEPHAGELGPGGHVKVKDGTIFNVTKTIRS